MKRIFLLASAIAGLFSAASCQQENLEPEVKGGVTYEILLPEVVNTKAASHEYAEYDLYYEVYKTVSETDLADLTKKPLFENKVTMTGNSHTLHLDLLNDQDYTILFWANKKENYYFVLEDLRNVVVKEASSNNDDRDAFCGKDQIFQHDAAYSKKVELKRPFAQVNIATVVKSVAEIGYDITPISSLVKFTKIPTAYSVLDDMPVGENSEVTYGVNWVPEGNLDATEYKKVAMNYVLVPEGTVDVYYEINTANGTVKNTVGNVPVKKNYRTNIIGNLLTSNATYTIELKPGFEEGEYTVEGETTTASVTTSEDLQAAFADDDIDVITLAGDIDLASILTRAAEKDLTLTVKAGKTLTLDLNGKKLTAVSKESGKNYDMILVKGNLTVKNGTIEYKHEGENMGWGSSTNIFDVTAGGVLNLEGVTAKNLGGSDMGFVAHLNNWGEVTLNVDNCTLESNYVPVRVFNSGPDMNNVDIKNSTLKGVSAAFWVHNYTVADFGTEAKAEAQKALLNLNIYNQGNTFSPDLNGIRYGFTNSVRTDAYGITKVVSEDGTEVTLGAIIENATVRRGVAGAEENTTIKKVVVEEGVGVLYDRTFRRFYALETVELPSTLTTIGAAGTGVFQSCTNLKNIVLPESLTVLGKGSFQECSSLESINIPAGVTRIESDALRATGLKSVEFHEGVTYFGAQAFRDCKQLKTVVIKAPEFTVEKNAFGVMAAPYPGTTIYVVNPQMKAYLENTLSYANQYTISDNYLVEPMVDMDAVTYEGDAFATGVMENALWFNGYYFDGEAAIKLVDKTYKAIVVENCAGNFKNDVITVSNDNSSVMILQNLDLTLAEGKKLINAKNPTYQVFMSNITINGEKMTQETIAKYLENVVWYQVVEEI